MKRETERKIRGREGQRDRLTDRQTEREIKREREER